MLDQWRKILIDPDKQNNLTAAEVDHKVYISIHGRGSFKNSPALKKYIKTKLNRSSSKEVILNMKDCDGMDSTFMGVLAGLACIATAKNNCLLYLINLSEKNEQLLKTLGVSKILNYYNDSHTVSEDIFSNNRKMVDMPSDQMSVTQTSLEAHKKLVQIQKDNEVEFRSVIDLLEADIKKINNM